MHERTPIRRRTKVWAAILATVAMMVGSGVTSGAALADTPASPTLSVSKTAGLDPAGESITVTGTGYEPDFENAYVPGTVAGIYVEIGYLDSVWRPSEGAGSATRSAAYSALVQDLNNPAPYVMWHNDDNGDGRIGFTWTVNINKADLDAKSRSGATLAVFTIGAGGAVQADNEQAVPIAFAAPASALSVSKTTGINPAGEEIIVTGTNYRTDYASPYGPGGQAGFYAQIGYLDPTWRPSDGASSSARSNAYSAWVQGVNTDAPYVQWTDNHDGTADFTWKVDVNKAALDAKSRPGATLAVFTTGAGGTIEADNEHAVPISFGVPTPTLSVSKTTGIDPAGEQITVTGTNYDSSFVGMYPPGSVAGVYVEIGYLDSVWRPSEGAASATRSTAYTVWVQDANDTAPYLQWTDNGDGTANFSWTITVDKATLDAKSRPGATLSVFTVGAGGAVQADNEQAVPISFGGAATSVALSSAQGTTVTAGAAVTLTATVSPAVAGSITFANGGTDLATVPVDAAGAAHYVLSAIPAGATTITARFVPTDAATYQGSTTQLDLTATAPPTAVRSGSLTWGVKSDFRAYVTGPIAGGSITTTGVTTSGGAFVFPQSTETTYSAATGTGVTGYSGSVRFLGHGGALDITLKNPVVSITSPSSATLSVASGGATVALATLNLAAGSRSTADGSVSYAGVPAALTAAGVPLFGGNYSAGTSLDPVSFVIGSTVTPSTMTRTVAAFASAKIPPATPPATTGVILGDGVELTAGGQVTITADGFAPNEEGIMVVIYSTPVVLARNVTADANGVVTWTGSLPSGLVGEHTLTVQGSVNRGIVLNIPAGASAAVTGCTVDSATLTWGFKESFRSYISGTIANGSWTESDGATYTTPNFGWSGGTGGYDAKTAVGLIAFTGSVDFTGHDGALNTTIANPQLSFVDATTAYLLLDVTGTTQEGTAVAQKAVQFAKLTLPKIADDATTITLTGVPATLTEAGSEAFGTYQAGEQLDPVTLTAALDPGCAKPAVAAAAAPNDAVKAKPTAAGANLSWLYWVLLVVVLAAIAVAIVVVTRRRRSAKA